MTETPVPVVLVAGYLGAGKTTWINTRIRHGLEPQALILVNDFGAINIDAELIEYRDDRLIRLSNGCICCSLSESLAVQMSQISRWPSTPSIVYIEASGVAQPQRIIDLVKVSRQYRMRTAIGLVDASTVLDTLANSRVGALVVDQIAAADRLCVNRLSLLSGEQQGEVRRRLTVLNPGAEISVDMDSADADDAGINQRNTGHKAATEIRADGPAWQRFAVTLSEPVDRAELERTLERYAAVVVRAKGILKQTRQRSAVFQWSGGRAAWTPAARPAVSSQLIGIGFAGECFEALIRELETL